MPDRRGGSVAVVGECIDHDRHTRGSIALVAHFLQLLARELAGAALDRVLDAVGRHVDLASFLHREAQPEVAVGVASPLLGRDRNLATGAGERLATLGVDDGLFVLDAGPFAMARHYSSPPNMLSMILSQPDSNETSFTDLQDVAVMELGVGRCFL